MLTENELLPCPFCGGEARFKHIFQNPDKCMIGCGSCDASFDAVYKNEREATEMWNFRTPETALIDTITALQSKLAERTPSIVYCKDCERYIDSPMGNKGCHMHYNGRTEIIPYEPTHFCSCGKQKVGT